MVTEFKSDVLVIGAGGAGLRAAIEANECGASVVIVSKAPAGMNNATMVAGGGFRAAIKGFTPQEHLEDTLRVGNYLNDRHLLEVFVNEGGKRVLELERFGVEMLVRPGGISVGDTPGIMGMGMTKPMVEYLRTTNVKIVENVILSRLLVYNDVVVGAVGYDFHHDDSLIFSTKSVVLATGGAGALYKRTDCPLRTTGDGYSLAFRIGARLRDMEFVQFFPVALAEPGLPPYLIGAPFSEEGQIVNRLREDIPMKHGITERPLVLKSRGPLSVAIMREIQAGNGVDGAVLLDAREPAKRYAVEEWFTTQGYAQRVTRIGASEKLLKIAPICHFNMGGLIINVDGETNVPCLYAAGEVVGGIHGANRHGGNALTDITVFGARAGAASAANAKRRTLVNVESLASLAEPEIERYRELRNKQSGVYPNDLMWQLRDLMWEKVGILRHKSRLNEALSKMKDLREMLPLLKASKKSEMREALEVPMALDVSEMIAKTALERMESRGAHFRKDYPNEDEDWMKIVIVKKGDDGAMELSTMPVSNNIRKQI